MVCSSISPIRTYTHIRKFYMLIIYVINIENKYIYIYVYVSCHTLFDIVCIYVFGIYRMFPKLYNYSIGFN